MRAGVFLCECGGNISGVVDLEPLAEHARSLDGVVEVNVNQFMCGTEGRAMIEKAVEERGLDHFVIASCSPRFQGPTFERIARELKLGENAVAFGNIREGCSYVHAHEPERAQVKAKKIVEGAVARLQHMSDLPRRRTFLNRSVLVVGGGIAGISAAEELAAAGIEVHLVERQQSIGGYMSRLSKTFPTEDCAMCSLAPRLTGAATNSRIHIHSLSDVTSVTGPPGEFNVTVRHRAALREREVRRLRRVRRRLPGHVSQRVRLRRQRAHGDLPAVRQRRPGDVRRRPQGLEPVQDRLPGAHLRPRLRGAGRQGPLRGGLPGRQRAEPLPERLRPHLHARVRDRVHARQRRRPHRHRRHQALRGRPRRAGGAARAAARVLRRAESPSSAAAPQASPPPASSRSSATRRPCSRLSRSPAACCASASPSTACRAPRCRARSTASPPWASSSGPGCAAARTSPSTRCSPTATRPSSSRPACTRARTCPIDGLDQQGVVRAVEFLRAQALGETPRDRQARRGRRRRRRGLRRRPHRLPLRRRARSPSPASRTSARRRPRPRRSRRARRSRSTSSTRSCRSRSSATAARRTGVKFQRCTLGEPNERGWRPPVPVEGEFVELEADTVIFAVGQAHRRRLPRRRRRRRRRARPDPGRPRHDDDRPHRRVRRRRRRRDGPLDGDRGDRRRPPRRPRHPQLPARRAARPGVGRRGRQGQDPAHRARAARAAGAPHHEDPGRRRPAQELGGGPPRLQRGGRPRRGRALPRLRRVLRLQVVRHGVPRRRHRLRPEALGRGAHRRRRSSWPPAIRSSTPRASCRSATAASRTCSRRASSPGCCRPPGRPRASSSAPPTARRPSASSCSSASARATAPAAATSTARPSAACSPRCTAR